MIGSIGSSPASASPLSALAQKLSEAVEEFATRSLPGAEEAEEERQAQLDQAPAVAEADDAPEPAPENVSRLVPVYLEDPSEDLESFAELAEAAGEDYRHPGLVEIEGQAFESRDEDAAFHQLFDSLSTIIGEVEKLQKVVSAEPVATQASNRGVLL